MKVYTKTGDKGLTSLIGGVKVAKHDLRIEAYGTIDELNSFVGLVRDVSKSEDERGLLYQVQNVLFVIGSHLASAPESRMEIPDLNEKEIIELEQAIDKMELSLSPLKNFVLPGGHVSVSYCHLARCVCRRAERKTVALAGEAEINASVLPYLNRLSDYFFVLSRKMALDLGAEEIIWKGIRG